jgi:hypothetical protein
VVALHPVGQHLSEIALQAVIGVCEHVTLQVPLAPSRTSLVHAMLSSHVTPVQSGVAGATSHVSAPSRTPLPQSAGQSESFVALHAPRPAPGQHPSRGMHAVMAGKVQVTLHAPVVPLFRSVVQTSPSLHTMLAHTGAPGATSQVSAASRTPFPHTAPQSLSFVALQPGAQQPSALMHLVMLVCVHVTLHAALVPLRTSVVQAMLSLQLTPAHVVAGATSHVSPRAVSIRPLPQPGQSTSAPGPHPVGQNPSAGPHARGVVVQR